MISQSELEERRITLRLLAYWERKRGTRAMPLETDFDPADIADLWEYCFIAHTQKIGQPGYSFSYLGRAIADVYHEGSASSGNGAVASPNMDILAAGYKEVVEHAKPLVTEGELTNPHGDLFKYRQVLLPLGENGVVKAVFGGMRFLRVVTYR